MRVLAFSDLHTDCDAAAAIAGAASAADLMVGAGDFGTAGCGAELTLDILVKCDTPLVVVAGNHDNLNALRRYQRRHPHLHLLDGTSISLGGFVISGIGGEIPANGDHVWNEGYSESEAASKLESLPACDLLISHSPPHGHADLQRNGVHEGSIAVRKKLEVDTPSLCLCGHIHHAWGTQSQLGDTAIYNLGPTANWFTLER